MSPRAQRPIDALLDSLPRLTLVAGKGGVGKTTSAAALALAASRRGGRTLLLSTDPAGTLGDALGVELGPDPKPIPVANARAASRGSLDSVQLDAATERRRFLDRWRETIVTIIDRGTYLDLDDITGLVDAALPGADEIFAVLRLGALESVDVYDRIIVDTAPTGHTLRLLDLPRTFQATVQLLEAMQSKHRFMVRSLTHSYRPDRADSFLEQLRRQIEMLIDALRDPSRSAAVLVTRAEPLVIAETERYAAELTIGGIRIAAVIANAISGNARAPINVAATRYVVPELAEPPLGVAGLRRWGEAMTHGSATTRARPVTTARSRRRPTTTANTLASAQATDLLFPALTIVGGKGGVGKTTAACALAIAAAATTPDVLLVSTDPAPSIGDALDQPIGDSETPVDGVRGLVARQMDATAAFREFRQRYQERIDALFDSVVRHGIDVRHDREIIRELLALSPPGVDELYALASLGETLDERRFARVIVDPAPTGHLLRLLQMPPLALDWSHRLMRLMLKYREVAGLGDAAEEILAFARRTRRVGETLRDPRHAGMVIVTLDESLVRGETARLISASRAEGVTVGSVLWNRWTGRGLLNPLPVEPPVTQFVAPAVAPPPAGAEALRAWMDQWREVSDGDG